jgi:hypothetical protein
MPDLLIDLTSSTSDDESVPAPPAAAVSLEEQLSSDVEVVERATGAANAEDIELGDDEDLVVTGDVGDVRVHVYQMLLTAALTFP